MTDRSGRRDDENKPNHKRNCLCDEKLVLFLLVHFGIRNSPILHSPEFRFVRLKLCYLKGNSQARREALIYRIVGLGLLNICA
ncbi:hypothetical protein VNO80_24619 [Phaseolus coccineus]|uniref:Uncharacterized protein n=1 Tax=Phaseolus coccineus TaxID=3886 RepID=A0AAN9LT51_PHACN